MRSSKNRSTDIFINRNHVRDSAALEFAKTTTLAVLFIMFNDLSQVGMDALSENLKLSVVWYGEKDDDIKTINRHYVEENIKLDGEQLSKD
jgi:hypothetical protein